MPVNPCLDCPLSSLHRTNSELRDRYKTDLDEALLEKVKVEAGRGAVRNFVHTLMPTPADQSAYRDIAWLQKQYIHYNDLMPGELQAAIEDCTGPYKRIEDMNDGTGAQWLSRLCGALVTVSDIRQPGGCIIEAAHNED